MTAGFRRARPEKILVLTGQVHSGKTTFLKRAAASWTSLGLDVGGFLSEVRCGIRGIEGYDLFDLTEGKSTPLLIKGGKPGWTAVGAYRIFPSGLERAAGILARDAARDILIVDEFGPLELAGLGLRPSFDAAVSAGARCLCVVRLSILEEFRTNMAARETVIFRLDDPGVLETMTREIVSRKESRG